MNIRYGFIHTQALPRDFDENEKKEKEIERQRAVKWAKMHKNFNKSSIREKLRRRIFKGIPDSLRGAIWQKLLGIDEKVKDNPNMYKKMLTIGHKYSTDIRQIDNDINRHETSILKSLKNFKNKHSIIIHLQVLSRPRRLS